MDVDIAVAMRLRDLLIVYLGKPVVGRDGAAIGKDEASDGIGNGTVLLDPPVIEVEIVVHDTLVIEDGGLLYRELRESEKVLRDRHPATPPARRQESGKFFFS